MSRVRSTLIRRLCLLPVLALLCPAVALAQDADHLLLGEVVVQARSPYTTFGSVYIEVVNPTASSIDLSDYYLTNGHDSQLGLLYWNVVSGQNVGGGTSGTFLARFPHGMSIAAGQRLVVSLAGSTQFNQAYGFLPDIELFEDGVAPDTVPEMREVFTGSIARGLGSANTNTPALGTTADSLVLFRWDGTSETVQDVDYLFWGANTRYRVDKTAVTGYQPDTAVGSQSGPAAAPNFGQSFRRANLIETTEPQTGGNGITGHDETGEDLNASWPIVADTPPGQPQAPSAWHPAAPITLTASAGAAVAGAPTTVTAQVVATGAAPTIVLVYRVDAGSWVEVTAGAGGGNNFTAPVPAQAEGAVVQWYLRTTSAGGGVAIWPVEGARAPRSFTVGAGGGGGGEARKLLITEVSTLGTDQEYVEIYNPNAEPVDLSDYYLTDAIHAPGEQYYWRIAEGNPSQTTVGGGAFADFHARFPDGYTVAAGDTIVVAIAGSAAFHGHFGFYPHIELFGTGPAQRMRPVFGDIDGQNSIVGATTPTLSNASECVVLYHWDGASDLVTDIDIFFWGTSTNTRFSKTGVTVGGSTYQNETAVANQQPFPTEPTFGNSYHRTSASEAGQPGPPGNGVDGRDEVGEPLSSNFSIQPYDPARPSVAEPLILAVSLQNAVADLEVTVRARLQAGASPIASVTVYYTVDGGGQQSVEAGDEGGGFWEAVLGQYPAGTVLAWRLVVADTGGLEAVWPQEGGFETDTISEPVEPGVASKLLFTEVSITGNDQEFVEIFNPNAEDVDLSDYYLTDAIHAPGNQFYWRIAEGNPSQTTIGGGAFFDFHARFPDGYTIAAGDTIVVSIAGSDAFFNYFGYLPHIELFEDGPVPDNVPDMRPVFGEPGASNSIVGNPSELPTLTNASESLVLYHWDGASNLVTDIDVFFWGTSTSTRFSKTGVTVGGETYQDETAVAAQQPMLEVPAFGFSYHRVDADETGQPGPPGNGVGGRDEVGEPLPSTFTIAAYDPARPRIDGGPLSGVTLKVPARTFLPDFETFAFSFSTLPGHDTKVRLFDLDGRLVRTLYDNRFDGPPPLQVTWDGRDSVFERVRAGMYVIHLQAVDRATGKQTIKTAPVVVATRLK